MHNPCTARMLRKTVRIESLTRAARLSVGQAVSQSSHEPVQQEDARAAPPGRRRSPPTISPRCKRWSELIASGRIHGLKETALHGQFTSGIVEGVLGYRGPAHGAGYTVATEQAILRGSVDLALGRFGGAVPEIVAPFELKGAGTRDLDAIMPGRNKSPVQQAWEYATDARGVKWVLVSNYIELRLYGFGEGTTAFETFRLDRLTDPREYARFMLLLSADNLLSGRTRELLEESRREDRDITDSVYRDYRGLRHTLIAAVRAADGGIDPLAGIATAQKILDRVLFIAFAEDTGLLPRNTLGDAFKNRRPVQPVARSGTISSACSRRSTKAARR